jgi:hypothetical protein
MKIQDIPQVGKFGQSVTWRGRNGLIRRILVTPADPRTDRQIQVRELLAEQTRRFDTLTDAQQDAWSVAAAGYQSRPSLGQSGPLTGLQLFVRVNCKLGLLGQPTVDVPPMAPQFPDLAPQSLVITNTAGVVAVKLTCPTDRVIARCCGRARRRTRRCGRAATSASSASARRQSQERRTLRGCTRRNSAWCPSASACSCGRARWWTGSRAWRGCSRRGCLPPDG